VRGGEGEGPVPPIFWPRTGPVPWRNYIFGPPANIRYGLTVLIHNSGHFGHPLPFWVPAPRHRRVCRWLVTPLLPCRLLRFLPNSVCRVPHCTFLRIQSSGGCVRHPRTGPMSATALIELRVCHRWSLHIRERWACKRSRTQSTYGRRVVKTFASARR